MNKIIIGSTALLHWFPEANIKPKDRDYAVELGEKSYREVEYLYNPVLFREKYRALVVDGYLTADALYTLKISHMFWDIHWNKNIYYIQLMKDLGCKVIRSLFYDLYEFWKEYHGENKRSNLEMSAESFFTNAVKCEYDHDYLHTLLVNPPTFTKILVGEVEVSEDKFNDLSYEEKLSLVREEVYVMAWERAPTWDYRRAYEVMLKKFIISHAPLWEAIFILDNFKSLYRPEYNFSRKIEESLNLV